MSAWFLIVNCQLVFDSSIYQLVNTTSTSIEVVVGSHEVAGSSNSNITRRYLHI